jgi:cytochrome P450
MELQVLIPRWSAALHFELGGDADITPQTNMTLRPIGPVTMRVRPT